MSAILSGIIHGKTIVLNEDPGLLDGAQVEIVVHVPRHNTEAWGEGLRLSAGSLAHDPAG